MKKLVALVAVLLGVSTLVYGQSLFDTVKSTTRDFVDKTLLDPQIRNMGEDPNSQRSIQAKNIVKDLVDPTVSSDQFRGDVDAYTRTITGGTDSRNLFYGTSDQSRGSGGSGGGSDAMQARTRSDGAFAAQRARELERRWKERDRALVMPVIVVLAVGALLLLIGIGTGAKTMITAGITEAKAKRKITEADRILKKNSVDLAEILRPTIANESYLTIDPMETTKSLIDRSLAILKNDKVEEYAVIVNILLFLEMLHYHFCWESDEDILYYCAAGLKDYDRYPQILYMLLPADMAVLVRVMAGYCKRIEDARKARDSRQMGFAVDGLRRQIKSNFGRIERKLLTSDKVRAVISKST